MTNVLVIDNNESNLLIAETNQTVSISKNISVIEVNQAGAQGASGQGVPTGGLTGQVLAKIDNTNYNTQWTTPVVDHGALTGLADDDHAQYHNDARGDVRYYTKAQVDSALTGKANTSHTHAISDVTNLQTTLDGKQPLATVLTNTTASFTSALETKLNGIQAGAQVNTVDSVAGKTGVVTLVKGDVGLGNVDNTSDANKPVSTATQTALNLKANLAGATFTGAISATNLSGTNTGDQTSIVGITGTKAQFDSACTDGNFLYTGDAVPYTGATTNLDLGYNTLTAGGDALIQKTGATTADAVCNLTLRSANLGNFDWRIQNDRTTLFLRIAYTNTGTFTDRLTLSPTGDLTVTGSISYGGNLSIGNTSILGLNSSSLQLYNGADGNLYITAAAFNSALSRIRLRTASPATTRMIIDELGNVAVGSTVANTNAILDVQSTTKAAMMPRMTTAQKNSVASPTAGMMVYDSTLNQYQEYNGSRWRAIGDGATSLNLMLSTFVY